MGAHSSSPLSFWAEIVSHADNVKLDLIDLNPVELKYYPFMIMLDKCNGRCNAHRIYVPNKTKNITLNVFNSRTRTDESKN